MDLCLLITSVYIKQNAVDNRFDSSESWVILSPVEQSIKRKIEEIGVPLKDWDVSINYGIKTGANDAFIISGEKRMSLSLPTRKVPKLFDRFCAAGILKGTLMILLTYI